jgi:uncharacterized membrane protein YiaA
MLSSNLLRVSVVLLSSGMLLGIGMGMTHDFRLAPAHAHLNLVGAVVPFLAGLYYQAVPQSAKGWFAQVHVCITVAAALVFPIGIAADLLGGAAYKPLAIAGGLLALLGTLLFAIIVFRNGAPARE